MKPPSHSTAELFADLKAAWTEFKEAKRNNDAVKMETTKQRIREIQDNLDIATTDTDFQQAV
jgi:hypothetical protein